jgi:hypothetical protein
MYEVWWRKTRDEMTAKIKKDCAVHCTSKSYRDKSFSEKLFDFFNDVGNWIVDEKKLSIEIDSIPPSLLRKENLVGGFQENSVTSFWIWIISNARYCFVISLIHPQIVEPIRICEFNLMETTINGLKV